MDEEEKKEETNPTKIEEYLAISQVLEIQSKLLSEAIANISNSLALARYESLTNTIMAIDESTKASLKALIDSIKIPIISPRLITTMQTLSQSVTEASKNINYVTKHRGVNVEHIKAGLSGTIHAQNAYIELLERTLEEKDEVIKQLKQRIDDTKKKRHDSFVV